MGIYTVWSAWSEVVFSALDDLGDGNMQKVHGTAPGTRGKEGRTKSVIPSLDSSMGI